MAAPPSAVPRKDVPDRAPPTVRPIPLSPVPGPIEAPVQRTRSGPPRGVLTIGAIVASLVLAVLTVLFVPEDQALTGIERTVLVVIGSVVALAGLIPVRWGWYVMGVVTVAFFALNIYNLLNPEGTVFQVYRGSSYTFAILLPAVGVAVGAVAQVVYRVVGGR